MKLVVLFFLFPIFGFSQTCERFISCKHPSKCGDIDFYQQEEVISVSYDGCARGGYNSYFIATYMTAGEPPFLFLKLDQRNHASAPETVLLGECLSKDVCLNYFK